MGVYIGQYRSSVSIPVSSHASLSKRCRITWSESLSSVAALLLGYAARLRRLGALVPVFFRALSQRRWHRTGRQQLPYRTSGVQKSACSSEGRYKAVRFALPAHFRAGAPEAPQLPG
jgi:hypothetical protein